MLRYSRSKIFNDNRFFDEFRKNSKLGKKSGAAKAAEGGEDEEEDEGSGKGG